MSKYKSTNSRSPILFCCYYRAQRQIVWRSHVVEFSVAGWKHLHAQHLARPIRQCYHLSRRTNQEAHHNIYLSIFITIVSRFLAFWIRNKIYEECDLPECIKRSNVSSKMRFMKWSKLRNLPTRCLPSLNIIMILLSSCSISDAAPGKYEDIDSCVSSMLYGEETKKEQNDPFWYLHLQQCTICHEYESSRWKVY